ncbi:DUF4262 domain-containing protein [Streptomyces sp. NPDC050625]|uniref:DUF4262 domain-containing protein n=1 Tax=Streptomyces sp. NPDC050625 TaxID=3154629 RepID=UPI003433B2AA
MPHECPACRCVICHDYGDRDEADRLDLRTVEQVQEHGWSVMMVPADDEGPGFAYTIGLWHTHAVPELAVFGLDIQTMHALLNTLGSRAAQGAVLESGQEYREVVEARPVVLKETDLRWYREFFGRAISFYRRPPFPVLQVVWPDAEGRYLWQPGADEHYRQSQPQSWLKPTEHPRGVWATLVSG